MEPMPINNLVQHNDSVIIYFHPHAFQTLITFSALEHKSRCLSSQCWCFSARKQWLSSPKKEQREHSPKHLLLCSTEEIKSGTTHRWLQNHLVQLSSFLHEHFLQKTLLCHCLTLNVGISVWAGKSRNVMFEQNISKCINV